MGLMGYVAGVGGRPEGKRPLGRPWRLSYKPFTLTTIITNQYAEDFSAFLLLQLPSPGA